MLIYLLGLHAIGPPNINVTNVSYIQSFLTCTQHIFLISKNTLNSGNKNPELKIIYSEKINPEVIIEFRK